MFKNIFFWYDDILVMYENSTFLRDEYWNV